MTRTGAPKARAIRAVSSVQALQTTTTSISPVSAPVIIACNVRAMTELSLRAGTTTEIIAHCSPAARLCALCQKDRIVRQEAILESSKIGQFFSITTHCLSYALVSHLSQREYDLVLR